MADFPLHCLPEWAPQSKSLVGWPSLQGILKDDYEKLANATIEISVRYKEAEEYFSNIETPFPITLHRTEEKETDIWLRDFAPGFAIRQGLGGGHNLVGVDWNFNGCGAKYPTSMIGSFARRYLQYSRIARIETSIVTEGGALETDGEGTLLVTESSIVNDTRNPGKSRENIEIELQRALGVEKIIWIPGRKGMDSTDFHIDGLVRFTRPGHLIISKPNGTKTIEWTAVYKEALEILSVATDAKGRPFEIIEIEEPDPEIFPPEGGFQNKRALYSYVSYVLVNGGVILPQFGDPKQDEIAAGVMQQLFGNERGIFPVLIEDLPRLGGGIHRVTQEISRLL
ncbi:putative agmatine deiminase [Trichoderma evansii]